MKNLFIIIVLAILMSCTATVEKPDADLIFLSDGIYCELSDNADVRTYHIRGGVSCGTQGQVLALAIYQVEGAQSVYPQPYEITVSKSCLYDWKDIEAEMVKRHGKIAEQMELAREAPEESGKGI